MKKLVLVTALSTALLAMSSANAGSKGGVFDDTSGGGATLSSLYGGAAIGGTFTDNCSTSKSTSFDGDKECERNNDSTAWKIYGGYKFMPNFAVEGAYIDLGEYSTTETVSDAIYGPQVTKNAFEAKAVTLMGVASANVTDDIELFGKLGAIHWERDTLNPSPAVAKIEDSGTDLALGVGAAYKIGDNFAIRGEAEHFDDIDVNLFTLGGTFSSL